MVIGGTLNVGADNTSTTFSGQFGAGGFFADTSQNLTKIGTGTLTLSGLGSVLVGNLNVNAGVLSLTGTLSAATTGVASGATLSVDGGLTSPDGNDRLGGTLARRDRHDAGRGGTFTEAVTNNGTISPGHSPGILNIRGQRTRRAGPAIT